MLRGFNRVALEIDPRVREYDTLLQCQCSKVVEELESMTENDLQDVQERAIKRLGGVLDVQTMLPKEVKIGKKITTHLETYEYIQKGMTLDEITQIRDLKPTTILSHLEKLLEEKKTMNLTPYRPEDE